MLFSIRVCQSVMKLKKLFTSTRRSTAKSTTVLHRSAHSALWISTAPPTRRAQPANHDLRTGGAHFLSHHLTSQVKWEDKSRRDPECQDVNLTPFGHASNKKPVLIFKEDFDPCMLGGDFPRGRATQIPERNTAEEEEGAVRGDVIEELLLQLSFSPSFVLQRWLQTCCFEVKGG